MKHFVSKTTGMVLIKSENVKSHLWDFVIYFQSIWMVNIAICKICITVERNIQFSH